MKHLLCTAVAFVSAALAQSPTLVQQAANSASNVASLTLTLSHTPVVGNVLVVCHDSTAGSASTVTGGGVTHWTLCQTTLPSDNSEIWAGVVDAAAGNTSTITLGGSPNSASAIVSEWHGLQTPLSFTGASTTGTDGASTPAVSGSVAAHANDLVVAMIGVHSGGGETITPLLTQTPGNAELQPPAPAASSIMDAVFIIPPTAASVSTSWTLGFAHIWASAIVVFRSVPPVVPATTVSGTVFEDTNHDGIRETGEGGVAGATVRLSNGTTTLTTTTDSSGHYQFSNVPSGNYTVSLQLGSGLAATTPTSDTVAATGSGSVSGGDFGVYHLLPLHHDGHGIGYWCHGGLGLVTNHLLAALLGLVDDSGHYVAPATNSALASWLQSARATNMAYMLSAQFAAMSLNVSVGYVDLDMHVNSSLGVITIRELLMRSLATLLLHPYTRAGSPWRSQQEALKNALDGANNNSNWILP
jgi:hypothetical protein